MPISSPLTVPIMGQEEFARIDYQVMRCAFDSQNELGRLCDEVIYQNDLATRLQAAGIGAVRTEVPVTVTHRDFAKTYWLDLVVGDAAIYELKTVIRLAVDHDAQLLNYLFLQGANHGKLVNFRSPEVESRFVNTNLNASARHRLEIDARRWLELDDASALLRSTLVALLDDWGGFLELPLYRDALVHLLGGEERVVQPVPLTRGGFPLGDQRMHLVSADTAFRLTSLPEGIAVLEPHLRSLLRCSPLRAIQCINLARHQVELVTMSK